MTIDGLLPVSAIAVAVAFALDVACGEPAARFHPVVWMGRGLAQAGAPWPSASPRRAVCQGTAAWLSGALIVVAAAVAADAAIGALPWPLAHGVLLGLLLKPLLAWRLLRDEVAAVERALLSGLQPGREQLQRLVSRATAGLSIVEVRESALESLAENLNDSFVAPLFWFALGGLPAAALYRFANTADAMWGYRGTWEWAGKFSARADDVLSYAPARLTAALLALAAWRWPRRLRGNARLTPSPNGGWPMAMMALALNVRLTKPGVYVLHAAGRDAAATDMARGLRLAARAALIATLCAALLLAVPALRALP